MFQRVHQLGFTFQEYRDTQRRALPYKIERSSDGGSDERGYRGEQTLQVSHGGREELEEFGHSGNFAKFAKIENLNTATEPRSNKDDDESPTTATPTAPDERGVEEDVDRLHMYVTICKLYLVLVATQKQFEAYECVHHRKVRNAVCSFLNYYWPEAKVRIVCFCF